MILTIHIYSIPESPEIREKKVIKRASWVNTPDSIRKNFVFVEGGEFEMGHDYSYDDDEKPAHQVKLDSFYIYKYEVTQKLYKKVTKENPSHFKGENRPVEEVSWYDAVKFCNKLSKMYGLTPVYKISGNSVSCRWDANGYRLPTEAEWEYAARGGQKSKGYKYSGSDSVSRVANYKDGLAYGTDSAGDDKQSNELGLYDMSGNVREWCWDRYDEEYYSYSKYYNPKGPSKGTNRVLRGGGCGDWYEGVDVWCRYYYEPDNTRDDSGFRIVRNIYLK